MELCKYLILGVCYINVYPAFACVFPPELRGVWISSTKGYLRFNANTIMGYATNINSAPYLDFNCTENNGTRYLLKSLQPPLLFGHLIHMFVCLDIMQSADGYYYYVATAVEKYFNEGIVGSLNTDVDMQDVCNKNKSYLEDEKITLTQNISSIDNLQTTACPGVVFGMYVNTTFANLLDNTTCSGTTIDGCENKDILTLYMDRSCTVPGNTSMHCLFHYDISNTTYLYTYVSGTTAVSPTPMNGFMCVEIVRGGENLSIKIHPDYCTDLMSNNITATVHLPVDKEACPREQDKDKPLNNIDTTEDPTSRSEKGRRKTEGHATWAYFLAAAFIFAIVVIVTVILFLQYRNKCCLKCRPKPDLPIQRFSDMNGT